MNINSNAQIHYHSGHECGDCEFSHGMFRRRCAFGYNKSEDEGDPKNCPLHNGIPILITPKGEALPDMLKWQARNNISGEDEGIHDAHDPLR